MTTPDQTLYNLARLDPDYPAFAAAFSPERIRADDAPVADLADDVIEWLRAERPELSAWLDEQPSAPPGRFGIDPLAAAGALTAILFLLRSHIRFEGKRFFFEHKPEDSDVIKKVLDKLSGILGGKAGL